MSIKLKDTIYDLINNSDKLDGKDSSAFSLTSHTHSNYLTELPSHTHNYASTVKIGSTSYNVSSNIISLPAYPTLSSLDGAASSHTHDYLPLTGGTLTGSLIINSSDANQLKINYTGTDTNAPSYIYYTVENTKKASTGYYKGIAYIANEITSNAPRIGVTDAGIPQYWDDYTGTNKYTLLHTGNYSSYTLPKAGGAISAGGYISFSSPASTSITDSTAFAITYGKIQAAAPISIIADTDETNTEYIIMTSGYPVASATKANGLAVGKTTLTWKDSTVLTQSNATGMLNGTYVNVTGDTMTGILKLPLSGIEVGDCSSDTNQYRAFKAYNSNLSSSYAGGNTNYICLGHSASAGNATEIGFTYSASASTNNAASIGFNAGNRLKVYYNGGSGVGTAKLCSAISGGTEYELLHSGNYNTWAAAKSHNHSYLPLSGGTMTGTITSNVTSTTRKAFVFYGTEFLDSSGNMNLIDTASSTSWNVIKYAPSSSTSTFLFQVLKNGGNAGIGGTANSSYKLYVHGSIYGSSLFVSSANGITIGSDGGDTATRALKSYGNTTTYINIGYAPSAGNVAEIGWSYVGSASTSNKTYLGFYGGYGLHLTYNTKVATLGTSTDYVTLLTSGNWSNYISVGGFNGGTITNNLTINNTGPNVFYQYSGTTKGYTGYSSGGKYVELYNQAGGCGVMCLDTGGLVKILCNNLHIGPDIISGDTAVTAARYIRCVGKTGSSYINWGYSDTSGNIGELGFNYVGSASTSNTVVLGFHSSANITCYYNGGTTIKNGLTVSGTCNVTTLQIGGETITFTT